jgi:hypothetical protein
MNIELTLTSSCWCSVAFRLPQAGLRYIMAVLLLESLRPTLPPRKVSRVVVKMAVATSLVTILFTLLVFRACAHHGAASPLKSSRWRPALWWFAGWRANWLLAKTLALVFAVFVNLFGSAD